MTTTATPLNISQLRVVWRGMSPLIWRRLLVCGDTALSTAGSMARVETTAALRRLSDTELKVADPAEDIRDRKVVGRDGEDIGEVAGLLIDEHDRRVRFLEVASGGFLGLGQTKFLLPVDAITRISDDTVYVN